MTGEFRVNDVSAAPFAAVTGLALTLEPEKARKLAVFSQAALSNTAYYDLDLPLKVATLGATQRDTFAPEPGLGRFEYSATGMMTDYATRTRADFMATAAALLESPESLLPGSRHDRQRPRFQPGEEADVMRRVAAQAGLIADIFALDQALVGGQKVSVAAEFVQDRPSPWQALARPMHTDGMGMPGALHRSYIVRSVRPPEFLRDKIATSPLAQDATYQALTLGQFIPDAVINPWLTKAKAAGLVTVPEPYDVTLMSRQRTFHRSQVPERPEEVVPSTYLRVMVAPCTY